MEIIKDISEAWAQRVKSPILGSIAVALFAINWQPIRFLIFAKTSVLEKFAFFDANTSHQTLVSFPILLGLGLALGLPWIQLGGAILSRVPVERLRKHQSDVQHGHRIYQLRHKIEEEELRAKLLSNNAPWWVVLGEEVDKVLGVASRERLLTALLQGRAPWAWPRAQRDSGMTEAPGDSTLGVSGTLSP